MSTFTTLLTIVGWSYIVLAATGAAIVSGVLGLEKVQAKKVHHPLAMVLLTLMVSIILFPFAFLLPNVGARYVFMGKGRQKWLTEVVDNFARLPLQVKALIQNISAIYSTCESEAIVPQNSFFERKHTMETNLRSPFVKPYDLTDVINELAKSLVEDGKSATFSLHTRDDEVKIVTDDKVIAIDDAQYITIGVDSTPLISIAGLYAITVKRKSGTTLEITVTQIETRRTFVTSIEI